MDYEAFFGLWHNVMEAAGLLTAQDRPAETFEPASGDRVYKVFATAGGLAEDPFYASVELTWTWTALHQARTAFSENEVIGELFGRGVPVPDSYPPWLRVDFTLHATLPYESPLPVPEGETWKRWAALVGSDVEPLLPAVGEDEPPAGSVVSGWVDRPRAEMVCGPAGDLGIAAVRLEGWQAIVLPRVWEDAEHQPVDDGPEGQLRDLATRLRKALERWARAVHFLQPVHQLPN